MTKPAKKSKPNKINLFQKNWVKGLWGRLKENSAKVFGLIWVSKFLSAEMGEEGFDQDTFVPTANCIPATNVIQSYKPNKYCQTWPVQHFKKFKMFQA